MKSSRFIDAVGVAILTASAVLAVLWMCTLPIFAAPDEDNHYDYALSLATARRPLWPADGPGQNDTHPTIRYLQKATDSLAIRLDPNARVPPGYGTPAFFAELDRSAPGIDREAFTSRVIAPAPYLKAAYPIGYYGLIATAIVAAQSAFPHSVTAEFFAARFLNVVLLVLTLMYILLLYSELRVPRPWALSLLALTAFLPVRIQNSASVQPDNLAALLIPAALYYAIRFARSRAIVDLVALSASLAFLCATKRHIYAATAAPIAATLLFRTFARKVSQRNLTGGIVLFALPAVLTFAATGALLATTAPGRTLCPPGQAAPDALRSTLLRAPASFTSEFASTFLGGHAMQTFWLSFGWYGEAVTVGSTAVTRVLFAAIILGTVALLASCGWSLAVYAVRIRRRRASSRMARLLSPRNLPAAVLFVFSIVLFCAMAFFNGAITLQGRYWLPVVPLVWYCALWTAPGTLFGTRARAVRTAFIAALFAVLAVTNVAAWRSMDDRYYVPVAGAPADPSREIFAALHIEGRRTASADYGTPPAVLHVSGLAVDRRDASAAAESVLLLDGSDRIPARTHADVALACNNTLLALENAGLTATIDTSRLAPGRHEFSLLTRTRWSNGFIDTGVRGRFTVAHQ